MFYPRNHSSILDLNCFQLIEYMFNIIGSRVHIVHICVMAVFIYGVDSRAIQFIYIHVVIQFIICCICVVGGMHVGKESNVGWW